MEGKGVKVETGGGGGTKAILQCWPGSHQVEACWWHLSSKAPEACGS
jgi:hypothetical protein